MPQPLEVFAFFANAANLDVGDSVEFEVPFGWLVGRFVMRDVRKIFAFRQQALKRIFGR